MTEFRLEDTPEKIEEEAKALFREYMAQFTEEDFQEEGFETYMLAHGSDELKRYYHWRAKLQAEAEREGEMIG